MGFLLTDDGSWNTHIQNSINKVYGLSYRWKHLLQAHGIPYYVRIRLADCLILSHIRYGEEIFSLSNILSAKLQAAENHVMKIIFDLPKHTSTAGILHITGRLSILQRLKLRRLVNLCRINRGYLKNLSFMCSENKRLISKPDTSR